MFLLCFVVKNLGSDQSTQEVGRNTTSSLLFLPTLLSACFKTEKSTVEASFEV